MLIIKIRLILKNNRLFLSRALHFSCPYDAFQTHVSLPYYWAVKQSGSNLWMFYGRPLIDLSSSSDSSGLYRLGRFLQQWKKSTLTNVTAACVVCSRTARTTWRLGSRKRQKRARIVINVDLRQRTAVCRERAGQGRSRSGRPVHNGFRETEFLASMAILFWLLFSCWDVWSQRSQRSQGHYCTIQCNIHIYLNIDIYIYMMLSSSKLNNNPK